jgi:hypothetical protein
MARNEKSAGAESRSSTFETQVDDFEDLFTPMPGPWMVDWHANDSLFVVFFGINDMVRHRCFGLDFAESRP